MAYVVCFVLVFLAALSGAVFKPGPWYERLAKPGWTPPNWAFPTVWSVLYVMIAIAGALVWREAGPSVALAFWAAQLVLNAAWSWLFFRLKRMDLALLDIGLLWLAIAGFIAAAWPVSWVAAVLFVPYLAWVTAAGLLNRQVMALNPEAA